MKRTRSYTGTLLIYLLVIGLVFGMASGAVAQVKKGKRFSSKSNCIDCHPADKFKGTTKHSPFEHKECQSCHKPHGIVGMLRLVKEGADLLLYAAMIPPLWEWAGVISISRRRKENALSATARTPEKEKEFSHPRLRNCAIPVMIEWNSSRNICTSRWKKDVSPATRFTGAIINIS